MSSDHLLKSGPENADEFADQIFALRRRERQDQVVVRRLQVEDHELKVEPF